MVKKKVGFWVDEQPSENPSHGKPKSTYNKYDCHWVAEQKLKNLTHLVDQNPHYVPLLENIISIEDPYNIVPQHHKQRIHESKDITVDMWGKFHVSQL